MTVRYLDPEGYNLGQDLFLRPASGKAPSGRIMIFQLPRPKIKKPSNHRISSVLNSKPKSLSRGFGLGTLNLP